MCRFLVYKGREMFMSALLMKSEQSLIRQSFKAREREEPLNGDGFGVGWYSMAIDPTPCVFTSVTPAWSNRNLYRLSEKIRSTCFFAHVRAASPGSLVTEVNCHPFQYGRFLWMHNGRIPRFSRIKRRLRESLKDEFYNFVQGTTDSEHAFALFLNKLRRHMQDYSVDVLARTMSATIRQLDTWVREAKVAEPQYYNFAVTDGENVIATRYVSDFESQPQSLYVCRGDRLESHEGKYRMIPGGRDNKAVVIASEPLTAERSDWDQIPANHLVVITPELHVRVAPIK